MLKNIKISKDTDGAMNDIQNQSKTIAYQLSVDELKVWRSMIFAHLHEAYRRTLRK